jgi:hypothetical protein
MIDDGGQSCILPSGLTNRDAIRQELHGLTVKVQRTQNYPCTPRIRPSSTNDRRASQDIGWKSQANPLAMASIPSGSISSGSISADWLKTQKLVRHTNFAMSATELWTRPVLEEAKSR